MILIKISELTPINYCERQNSVFSIVLSIPAMKRGKIPVQEIRVTIALFFAGLNLLYTASWSLICSTRGVSSVSMALGVDVSLFYLMSHGGALCII
jgi:hypothetical protein